MWKHNIERLMAEMLLRLCTNAQILSDKIWEYEMFQSTLHSSPSSFFNLISEDVVELIEDEFRRISDIIFGFDDLDIIARIDESCS